MEKKILYIYNAMSDTNYPHNTNVYNVLRMHYNIL